MKIDWLVTLRDVFLVLVVAFLGSFLSAILSGADGRAVMLGAFVSLAVAFFLVAQLARQDRFRHLAVVGGGVWILGSTINLVSGRTRVEWLGYALLMVAASAFLGGLASMAMARTSSDSTSSES